MRTTSSYQLPAVPNHTPMCGSLSTPNTVPVFREHAIAYQTTPQGSFEGPAYTYVQLSGEKYANALYPSFFARANKLNISGKGTFIVSNLVVKVQRTPIPVTRLRRVGAGSTLNMTLAGRTLEGAGMSHAVGGAAFEEGAKVTARPKFAGMKADVLYSGVRLEGSATVSPANGGETSVGDFSCAGTGSKLTVTGGNVRFALPLTVTLSDDCPQSFASVDYGGATLVGSPDASAVCVKTERGKTKRRVIEFADSEMQIWAPGFMLNLR